MRTDLTLIKAIRDYTDHEAWQTFDSRYAPMIAAYCVSRGLDRNTADDIAQEVFLRICKHSFADRFNPEQGTFRSYLFRVVRSVVASLPKRARRHGGHQQHAEDPRAVWERAWREHAVRLAIQRIEPKLSSRSREVLSLSLRGVSPSLIADMTGMTRDAVYKSRARVREEIEWACKELDVEFEEL